MGMADPIVEKLQEDKLVIKATQRKRIRAYLLKASEAARLKRRTLSTMDIGAHGVDSDHNGIPDDLE